MCINARPRTSSFHSGSFAFSFSCILAGGHLHTFGKPSVRKMSANSATSSSYCLRCAGSTQVRHRRCPTAVLTCGRPRPCGERPCAAALASSGGRPRPLRCLQRQLPPRQALLRRRHPGWAGRRAEWTPWVLLTDGVACHDQPATPWRRVLPPEGVKHQPPLAVDCARGLSSLCLSENTGRSATVLMGLMASQRCSQEHSL